MSIPERVRQNMITERRETDRQEEERRAIANVFRKRKRDATNEVPPHRRTDDDDDTHDSAGDSVDLGRPRTEYYTFVLHKANMREDWHTKIATRGRRTPYFVVFDHDDHVHILFVATTRGGNASRSRTRIVRFLDCTDAGSAEAIITTTRVKYLERFILYCIRFGVQTTHVFGTKVQTELIHAHEDFKRVLAHTDPNQIIRDSQCKPYFEDRKDRYVGRLRGAKSRHLADIIMRTILDQNIQSAQHWESIVNPDLKMQLIREYSLSVDSYILKIIRVVKAGKTLQIKTKPLTELLVPLLDDLSDRYGESDFIEIIIWLRHLFSVNEIDLIQFFAWNEIIKCQRYIKINSLVL